MKLRLRRPCDQCPFRRGQGYLPPARVREIVHAISHDGAFPCHKTVDYVGGNKEGEMWCAGALAFMEHALADQGGALANMMVRASILFWGPDHLDDLGLDTKETYNSLEDMLRGQR